MDEYPRHAGSKPPPSRAEQVCYKVNADTVLMLPTTNQLEPFYYFYRDVYKYVVQLVVSCEVFF